MKLLTSIRTDKSFGTGGEPVPEKLTDGGGAAITIYNNKTFKILNKIRSLPIFISMTFEF